MIVAFEIAIAVAMDTAVAVAVAVAVISTDRERSVSMDLHLQLPLLRLLPLQLPIGPTYVSQKLVRLIMLLLCLRLASFFSFQRVLQVS